MTLEELIEREQKSGMTLAEVLIAIVVLGVTAALVIPAMAARKDRKEWLSALNKSFTTIANGFKNSEAINGKASKWGEDTFVENFMQGFKTIETCEDNSCVPEEHYLNGDSVTLPENATSYRLADGQIMTLNVDDVNCQTAIGNLEGVCGTVYVDINGEKRPNTWGKDYFGFYITQRGIMPFGTQEIDVVEDGYEWVSKGCNNGDAVCAEGKTFNCSNASNVETDCKTCGGNWTVYSKDAYSTPNYSHQPTTYKQTGYTIDHYDPVYGPSGYAPVYAVAYYYTYYYSCNCGYYCSSSGYNYSCGYSCRSCKATGTVYHIAYYYVTGYTVTGYTPVYAPTYAVDKTAHDYISSYTQHDAIYQTSCPGGATDSVCLGYKYTQEWDCWHNPNGEAFDNECNLNGTASTTSCKKEFKQVNALDDCNLDGHGTSCGAWAIINGNMIYLDSKEVMW